ncbi:MAG: hypothetical protein IKW48_00110 [Akkermansia sp.]|nr:hypothetical protein [Akkermansia sp.]
MKLFKNIAFALAAVSCVQFAAAQQAPKLNAYVALPGGAAGLLELERGDGNGSFFYMQKGTDQLMQAKASACKMFYIQTPPEMANALREFYGGDYAAARKGFATVKKKYAAFAGLPGSPCTMAALHEVTCAVRLLDIAAVKSLSGAFAEDSALNAADAARMDAARVVGMIDDNPESFAPTKEAVEAAMKKHGRNMDSEANGWLRYALARAAAAQVPADQLQGTIAEDKVRAASVAVDFYCQAVMSMHGSHKAVPADALSRALALLWAMPGVKEYAAKVTPPMDKAKWNPAPADFRDAAAMARYIKTMYPAANGAADPLVDKVDAYYFNAKAGTKKGDK